MTRKEFIKGATSLAALGAVPAFAGERGARERPRTKVAFTFDDGFKDGITVAAPILEKYGYRGMFCIPPSCVDAGNGLSWDDVRELMRRGHEISLHDGDPVGLCRKGRRDEAKAQLIRGRDRIREMTGVAPRFWTPPGQQISPDALALVKECGMITTRADRPDHGKATVAGTPSGVGAWLDQQLRYHPISIVLMCHAVTDPGYNSFGSAKQFEDYVKEVKEREEKGLFDVVTYPELEPSEIQAIASTPKWTLSYRDGEGHSHTVDSAELSYSVKTNGPNMRCEWKGAAPFHVTMNYVATLDGARIWGWIENASKDCIATAFSGPFVAEQTNGTYKEVRDFEMGTPYAFEHTFELTPKKRFWELPVPIFYKN